MLDNTVRFTSDHTLFPNEPWNNKINFLELFDYGIAYILCTYSEPEGGQGVRKQAEKDYCVI